MRRGVADPLTLALVALVALGAGVFGTSWHPLDFLRPKPPTAELTKLQSELNKAQTEAEAARLAAAAALVAERARLETQIRAAQQDNAGAAAALGRVTPEHATAEVKLAAAMTERVSLKLAAAIGALPPEQRAAMVALIEQALSDKQADVDAAHAKLAQRDREFSAVTAEREAIRAQIPLLEKRAATAEATATAAQAEVTAKTETVKTYAAQADAKTREAHGLRGAMDSAFRAVLWVLGGWGFLVFVLPGIVKHLAEGNRLKPVLRNIAGYVTSPMLFHDARAKLAAAVAPETG